MRLFARNAIALTIWCFTTLAQNGPAHALDRATDNDARNMVKKAIVAIKENGREKTYKEISKYDGDYADRDLNLVVIDANGKCLASGARSLPVGKNLMDEKDAEGRGYISERIQLAKTNAFFWQIYSYLDPLTRRVFPKKSYCETLEKTIICGSVYNTP